MALMFLSNYRYYFFPYFNHYQYSGLYVPFIFLLILDNIQIPDRIISNPVQKKNKVKEIIHILKLQIAKRRRAVVFFVIIIITAVIFQPYSPFNNYDPNKFNMNIYPPNMNTYADYVKVVNLIPPNDPYVLYQGNLPYVDVHDPALSCLGVYSLMLNSSNYAKIMLMNGTISSRVDYVMGYEYGNQLNSNFSKAVSRYYSSGSYGVEAFLDGFLLLARNYDSPPVYLSHIPVQTHNISNFIHKGLIFTIPYISPGIYNLNFSTNSSSTSVNIMDFNSSNGINVSFSMLNEKIFHVKNTYYVNVTVNIDSFIVHGYALFDSSGNAKFQNVSIFGPNYNNSSIS